MIARRRVARAWLRRCRVPFQAGESYGPSDRILEEFLAENHVPEALRTGIVAFFRWVQSKYPLGHTFFRTVKDEESLRRLWETQLRFAFEKQFKYEPETLSEIRARFVEITGITLA